MRRLLVFLCLLGCDDRGAEPPDSVPTDGGGRPDAAPIDAAPFDVAGSDGLASSDGIASHTLMVTVVGPGRIRSTPAGIDCPGTCLTGFTAGSPVTLTAEPSSLLAAWTGDCVGAAGCAVIMDAPRAVTATFDGGGDTVFFTSLGGANDQWVWDLASSPDGDLAVVGSFYDSASFGGAVLTPVGMSDGFVLHLSPTGTHVASFSFGSAIHDYPLAVAMDADRHIAIAGIVEGDAHFGGQTYPGLGDGDWFVARTGPDGTPDWFQLIGSTGRDDPPLDVAVDSGGDVYVVGRFSSTIDLGGQTLTADFGLTRMFIARYAAADGALQWARDLGRVGYAIFNPYSIATGDAGDLYLGASYMDSIDVGCGLVPGEMDGIRVLVARFETADGDCVWSWHYDGTLEAWASEIAVAGDEIAVAGRFRDRIDFGGDELDASGWSSGGSFVARMTRLDGAHVWSRAFGSPTGVIGISGVTLDESGAVGLIGGFNGEVDFGDGPVSSPGENDVWMARYLGDVRTWLRLLRGDVSSGSWAIASDARGYLGFALSFAGEIMTVDGPASSMGTDIYVGRIAP